MLRSQASPRLLRTCFRGDSLKKTIVNDNVHVHVGTGTIFQNLVSV